MKPGDLCQIRISQYFVSSYDYKYSWLTEDGTYGAVKYSVNDIIGDVFEILVKDPHGGFKVRNVSKNIAFTASTANIILL